MLNYQILEIPFNKEIHTMNSSEAKAYFEWYMNQRLPRSVYLFSMAGYTESKYNAIAYTTDSLIIIWRWFLRVAQTEMGSKTIKLSYITEGIIRDIGMYLGDTFVHNYPKLHWEFHTKPKKIKKIRCAIFQEDACSTPSTSR